MKTLRTSFECDGKACTVSGTAEAIREYLKDLKAKGKRITVNSSRASANAPLILNGVEQLRLSSYEKSEEAEGPIPPRFNVNAYRKERGLPPLKNTQSYHGAADFDNGYYDDEDDSDDDVLNQVQNYDDDDDDESESSADDGPLVPPTFNRERWLASRSR